MGIIAKEAEEFTMRILISDQALNRLKRDKYIKQNKDKYNKIIFMIAQSKLNYEKEKNGDFWVSPKGGKSERVAWHFEVDIANKIIKLFIDDILYHEGRNYIENWDINAINRKIILRNYGPWENYNKL
ncbi:MAG: hypothetical protein PHD81_00235 [Candidatus Nanoarchaeia archaeon]|nr:hypothetical protein [Candidatus Nanoarchaeia archaeon]MDD5587519.1 hypothetical protein [Candidatus Nanoarchaeia archaeon]